MRGLLAAMCLMAAPAFAQDLATGEQISAAVSGNTVMGSMSTTGAYAEYYAPDGAIRAADYSGKWWVEANTMCFTYGEDAPTCWGMRLAGDQVTWIVNGAAEGTGTILAGNPNGW